jgi:hypothetical protein
MAAGDRDTGDPGLERNTVRLDALDVHGRQQDQLLAVRTLDKR